MKSGIRGMDCGDIGKGAKRQLGYYGKKEIMQQEKGQLIIKGL